MNKLAFDKMNYILLAVGVAIILLGLLLMSGAGTTEETFNEDIFSTRRTTVAPLISFFGFIFIIVAIMYKPRNKQAE